MTRLTLLVLPLLLALSACGGDNTTAPFDPAAPRELPTSPPEYHGWACPHVDVDAPCIPLPPTPPVTPEATE